MAMLIRDNCFIPINIRIRFSLHFCFVGTNVIILFVGLNITLLKTLFIPLNRIYLLELPKFPQILKIYRVIKYLKCKINGLINTISAASLEGK